MEEIEPHGLGDFSGGERLGQADEPGDGSEQYGKGAFHGKKSSAWTSASQSLSPKGQGEKWCKSPTLEFAYPRLLECKIQGMIGRRRFFHDSESTQHSQAGPSSNSENREAAIQIQIRGSVSPEFPCHSSDRAGCDDRQTTVSLFT
jgi:hypothetical protein